MRNGKYTTFAVAAGIYFGFAIYLYQPYFEDFNRFRHLLPANACLACLGCYVLSRRWMVGFMESFFAGAIYGFGPFTLGLAKFHPTASLLVAAIPWLFCPAVFIPKTKWRWLSVPLSVLPFVAILLIFQIFAYYRLFPIMINAKLHLVDLVGLSAPLVAAQRGLTLIGFYHVPIAALIIGFSILLTARRFGIIVIFSIGTILAFCDSFLNVSPIIWLSIPVLCCSVLVGVGMQGLVCAGFADRRWILADAVIMGILTILTLLFATKYFQTFLSLGSGYARLFVQAAKMYILGAIVTAMLFFLTRTKLRTRWLWRILLYAAMALDIFLGAQFIVDGIF